MSVLTTARPRIIAASKAAAVVAAVAVVVAIVALVLAASLPAGLLVAAAFLSIGVVWLLQTSVDPRASVVATCSTVVIAGLLLTATILLFG